MKKIYLFVALSLSVVLTAQTYNFDFLTKYSSTNTKNKFSYEFINYFNTDDFTYNLSLAKSKDQFVAILFDKNKELKHHFTVTESKEKGMIQFQFQYDYSYKSSSAKNKNQYIYEFSEVDVHSKNVTLKIFKNDKKKKQIKEQQLTLKPANVNLFPIYQETLLAQYPSNQTLTENYIVSKAVEHCEKCTCEVELKEYKNVELQINLPKKLIF